MMPASMQSMQPVLGFILTSLMVRNMSHTSHNFQGMMSRSKIGKTQQKGTSTLVTAGTTRHIWRSWALQALIGPGITIYPCHPVYI